MIAKLRSVAFIVSILSTVGIGQQVNSTSTPKITPPESVSESMSYTPRVFVDNENKNGSSRLSKAKSGGNQRETVAFSSNADRTLYIPVSVIGSDGTIVKDVKNDEFKAFIDGGEAEILSVERNTHPLAVILLLDTSASSLSKLEEVKDIASRMINYLHPEDALMVANFDTDLRIVSDFTTDRSVTAKAIKKLKAGNGTSLYSTIQTIFEKQGPKFPRNTAIILISDGVDTTSQDSTYERSLVAAEKFVVSVYPIYLDTKESSSNLKHPTLILTDPKVKPSGRSKVGSITDEYALGKAYLTDLLRLSGGRSVLANDVLSGQDSEYKSIPIELRARYFLFVRLPEKKIGERLNLKIQINRPSLTIFTKSTYVE
ncbi:MAG: VWA domain-containing protein [Blastocatellia bacterium]|nr:VWA domain-containing protein [Blastocatellia bacterium]